MREIKVLFQAEDNDYGKCITEIINMMNNELVISFNIIEKRIKTNSFDLNLFEGSTQALNKFNELYKRKIIYLTEFETESLIFQEEKNNSADNNEPWYVYKYDTAENIISAIIYVYNFNTEIVKFMKKSNGADYSGFFSACGGVGKTCIAIATARYLSRYLDRNVLYINYNEFSDCEYFIKNTTNKMNITDFLYLLFNKKDTDILKDIRLFAYTDDYGVSYLSNLKGRNELKNLNIEELGFLIKNINEYGKFDHIVFDMGHEIDEKILHLVDLFKNIFFIQEESVVSKYRTDNLINYLKYNNYDNNKKYIRVINKCNGSLKFENEEKTIYIFKDDISFNSIDNKIEISIYNDFGNNIKNVADEISLSYGGEKSFEKSDIID